MKIMIEILILIIIIIAAILLIITMMQKQKNISGGIGEELKYNPESYVLIYCHNKPVLPNIAIDGTQLQPNNSKFGWGHYLVDFFNQKIKEKKLVKMQVETVDMAEKNKFSFPAFKRFPYIHNKADGFDIAQPDSFINTHTNKYDIVFMPNCGDDWNAMITNEDYVGLADTINNVMKVVKSNGWLIVGKLFDTISIVLKVLREEYEWDKSSIISYDYVGDKLKFIQITK